MKPPDGSPLLALITSVALEALCRLVELSARETRVAESAGFEQECTDKAWFCL